MTQTGHFAWAIDLPKWSIFKMVSFLEYWLFFSAFFAQNNLIVLADSFSAYFWRKNFFTQTRLFSWAIALPKWSIFKVVSFLEYWLFFPAVFCTEQLNCSCRFIFGIFLDKTFFHPNCSFCMGYRLIKIVDFFKMVSFLEYWLFFPAVFCTEQLNCSCRFIFGIFLEKKIFDPNCPFCMGYRLTKTIDFQNGLHFSNIGCFFQRFFAQNNLIVLVDSFSAYFWRKNFLTQTAHFAWAIPLPKWSIFKMVLFLEYWLFFPAVFCTKQLNSSCKFIFGIFLEKKLLTQTAHFAWAIALPKWSIFKVVSFLEYWLFFPAVFCTEQLNSSCRFIFGIFLEKKFFDPNWPFCMGYRLTKMVDFQNGLISRTLVFFSAVFCTEQLNCSCRFIFGIFLDQTFFHPNWPFCMGYRLIKMVDFFKMVSFLEYWLFFPAVFCTEQLNCSCRFIFGIFLEKKFFDPNCPFCTGYRLTKMVDFQNGLISRILAVFSSVFLHRTT